LLRAAAGGLLLLLVLLVSACGSETSGSEQPVDAAQQPAATTTEATEATPGDTDAAEKRATATTTDESTAAEDAPESTPAEEEEAMSEIPAEIRERAQSALAAYLEVEPETLTLTGGAAVEWPDSSLGCPQPGEAYMQVIMEGYQLVFTDATGSEYAVNTTQSGDPLIVCEEDERVVLPSEGTASAPDLVPDPADVPDAVFTRARAGLSDYLGIAPDALMLDHAQQVEWPNSGMGCFRADQPVTQAIVEGYELFFSDEIGNVYRVHSTLNGQPMFLCEDDSERVMFE
jgi:hypothetical protein